MTYKYSDEQARQILIDKGGLSQDDINETINYYQSQNIAEEEILKKLHTKAEDLTRPNYITDILGSAARGIGKGLGAEFLGEQLAKPINKYVRPMLGKESLSEEELDTTIHQNLYKPQSGIGNATEILFKYITGTVGVGKVLGAAGKIKAVANNPIFKGLTKTNLKKDITAGAIADNLLWERGEGHLIPVGEFGWDDNTFDIADRLVNAVEGAGIGLVVNKIINKFTKAKQVAKTPDEHKAIEAELNTELKQIEPQILLKDIQDQVGTDRQSIFKATQELPFEQAQKVLKEFDAQEEAKLLDIDASDNVLKAGAVESDVLEPYQMTKEEYRQSVAGDEQRVFTDEAGNVTGKVNGKIADRVLDETVDQAWEARGLNKADNENDRQWVQRVVDYYKAKWGAPEGLNVKVSIRDLKNKAGVVEILEDGSIKLTVNKNNLYTKAGLRHELEHLHDVIKGKVPQDTHFSRYGDEATFAADYSHKKAITAAIRAGKEIPENVAKEYADVIPNIDKQIQGSGTKVNDASGVNVPKEDLTGLKTDSTELKISKEDQLELDKLNQQLKSLDDPEYFEQKLREAGYPVDTIKGYEAKIQELEAEYAKALESSSKGNTKRLKLKQQEIDNYKAELESIKQLNTVHKEVAEGIRKHKTNLRNQIHRLTKKATEKAEVNTKLEEFSKTPEAQAFKQEVEAAGEVTDTAIKTIAKSDDVAGIVSTVAKTIEKHDPFVKETAEDFIENSKKFFKDMYDEIHPNNNDFDELFNFSDWTREQIRSARLFLGNMRKVQLDVNTEAMKLSKKFKDTPDGASKARLMDSISSIQEKLTKIDTSIRGSFSEAGRLLQSAQRADNIIEQINLHDDYAKNILKKDLADKGLDFEYFESVVKEATDDIQKLYAQGQGKLVSAADIEKSLIKAFGSNLEAVGVDAQWLKNEALRIFEDYKPGVDLNNLIRSSTKNIINFNKQLEAIRGFIASNGDLNFWNLVKKRWWNNTTGYYIQNLLSGIPTSIKNTTSGIAKTYYDNISRRLAGTREERELAALEFEALGRNFMRALEISKAVFKSDPLYGRAGQYIESTSNIPTALVKDNKLPIPGTRESWDIDLLGSDWQPTSAQEAFLKVSEVLGIASHKLSRWIPMTDEFLTSWNYLAKADAIETQAARKLLQQQTKGKYTLDQVRELADKEVKRKYFNPDTGKPVNEDILIEAREASLINPISNEEAGTTWLYGGAKAIQDLKSKHPQIKFVVPFVNALARLGQNTIDVLPGLAHIPGLGSYHAEIKAGGRRAALAQGKVYLGMTTLGMGYMLGINGKITGSPPMDRAEREALTRRGWKPYSFVIEQDGKTIYISYKDIEPFASVLGIGADLAQNLNNLDEDGIGETLLKTGYSLMRNIYDKTFFNSLAQQAELLDFSKMSQHTGQILGGMATAAIIPGSSFFNQISNLTYGDTLKEPKGFLQNIISRVPFVNKDLPSRLNDLGEEIEVPLVKRLTGIGIYSTDNNRVNDELTELAQYGLKLPAPIEDVAGGVHLDEYLNSNGMTAYDAIHRKKAEIKLGGKTLRQSLDSLINSKFYQQLPTGEGIEHDGWDQDYSSKYTKIGQISKMYQNYLKAAESEILWKENFIHTKSGVPLKDNYINRKQGKYPIINTSNTLQGAFGD